MCIKPTQAALRLSNIIYPPCKTQTEPRCSSSPAATDPPLPRQGLGSRYRSGQSGPSLTETYRSDTGISRKSLSCAKTAGHFEHCSPIKYAAVTSALSPSRSPSLPLSKQTAYFTPSWYFSVCTFFGFQALYSPHSGAIGQTRS